MNALYAFGRQLWLEGKINWLIDPIKAVLLDTGTYTPDLQNHQYLSAVPLAGQISVSGTLTNRTSTNGVADADDVTFTAVLGNSAEAIALFKDTGTRATSPLLFFIGTAVGLPVNPDGGSITVLWDNSPSRIFAI